MQSLRTQRPSARTQDPEQSPQARPRPKTTKSVPKDARKSRVDDRIKKRMSMRYADNLDYTAGAAIPEAPPLPTGRSAREAPVKDEVRDDPRAVDVNFLQRDDFDPEAYLKLKLANSNEAELKTLQTSLQASKAATATDLQRNIFKNYEEFITISKEISTLENDMLELKESISEWKSMPSLLKIEEASSSTTDRRRAQRSSVADLRVLYASQLQELHSSIEGSSKFVPATPGRHIICQVPDVYSLNPATYKIEYAVHLVLLDDALLVAKRRRRRNGERGRLVAERCWALGEVIIVEVKDTSDRTNIIKLRHGREGHVYRTDRALDKKKLLSDFRKTSEELAAKKRKEREGEHERRMSVWTTGDKFSIPDPSSMPVLPAWALEAGAGGAKEKAEADARWISEFSDDLTVAIALQEWDEAVRLVEEGGQKRVSRMPQLKDKLACLVASLTSALLHSLSEPGHRKTSVVYLTSLLTKLGAGPAARAAFLTTRGELIGKRIRSIPFEGDIPLYIFDLAIVVFTAIKHTAEWFLASFKENEAASHLVQWCKEQMEHYAVLFGKQVFSSDADPKMIAECNDITRVQNKKLLLENGLDFSYLLNELLAPPPTIPQPLLSRSELSRPGTPGTPGETLPPLPLGPVESANRPPPRSRDRVTSNFSGRP